MGIERVCALLSPATRSFGGRCELIIAVAPNTLPGSRLWKIEARKFSNCIRQGRRTDGFLGCRPPEIEVMKRSGKEPGEEYWSFIEPIWDAVSIYDGPDVFLDQFRKVTPEQGHIFAAHWCQSEVCNGGFHQFFRNPTGVLAPEASAGFRAIGLDDCAEILEDAMSFFGANYPREQQKREAILDRIQGDTSEEWDPFNHLNDKFYDGLNFKTGRFEKAADDYARQAAG
jgi:Domain of unknown function (DUF4375)